ncbi:MAG: hypothetical protein IPK04_14700 [Bdellovibrionales bacterium]|nr:hypothetical protein [Bdellovibrionales bacterium]
MAESLGTVQLEVRLTLPRFKMGEVKNTTDQGNLKTIFSANVIKKDDAFIYSLNSIHNAGIVSASQDEGLACARSRLSAYLGTGRQNTISPLVREVMNPCSILSPELETAAYESGFYKSVISDVFANVTPTPQMRYNGWETVLSMLAKTALDANRDIVQELDPSGKTKLVNSISRYLVILKSEIEKSKNLLKAKDTVLNVGLDWSFQGLNVSQARIMQILKSIDNSYDVFPASSTRLLIELARTPNSNDDELSFGISLDDTYKSEAQKALELAKDLNYRNFESDVFSQIIQRKTTLNELRQWSSQLIAVKTEINKYPSLENHKPKSVYELARLIDMDISNLNKLILFFETTGAIKIKTSMVSGRSVKTPIVEYGQIEFDLKAA